MIQPMTGATLSPGSIFVEFGRLPLNFREGGRSVRMETEGKHWPLEYPLEERRRDVGGELVHHRVEPTVAWVSGS